MAQAKQVLLFFCFWTLASTAFGENPTNRGIMIAYRYQFPFGDLINNSNVLGAKIDFWWREINTAPGEYDWNSIDTKLQTVKTSGKKACLFNFICGYGQWNNPYASNSVPDWVYQQDPLGTNYLEYTNPSNSVYTRYPVIWREVIKTNYDTYVQALAARYNNDPDIQYVCIGLYPELTLGYDEGPLSNDWKNAGYTYQVYEDTVKWFIDANLQHFTNKPVSVALNNPNYLMSNDEKNSIKANISTYLASKNTNGIVRSCIENNALRDRASWKYVQQYFREHHESAAIVYEAVDKASGGGQAGNFRAMIENGLTAHSDYFHIYYEDLKVATPGQTNYNSDYEDALAFAARHIGIEPGNTSCADVWLRFNATNTSSGSGKFFFQGLYCDTNAPYGAGPWPAGSPPPTNGNYVAVLSTGAPPRECVRTSQSSGDNFIYLNVDDRFICGGTNAVRINVEYLDSGTDTFTVEYDSLSNNYAAAITVAKTDSMAWLSTNVCLWDAQFTNRQSEGNDLRINSNGDGDDHISFVHIAKLDLDGDGMPDEWETKHLAGGHAPSTDDEDKDGARNIDEYFAGTDPGADTNCFSLGIRLTNEGILVTMPIVPASGIGYENRERFYRIEFEENLNSNVWGNVLGYERISATNSGAEVTNSGPLDKCFYRGKVWLE